MKEKQPDTQYLEQVIATCFRLLDRAVFVSRYDTKEADALLAQLSRDFGLERRINGTKH